MWTMMHHSLILRRSRSLPVTLSSEWESVASSDLDPLRIWLWCIQSFTVFFICNTSFIKLLNCCSILFWLVHTGREERQASNWSRSSEFFIFLQHLYNHFIFLGFAMFSFGLLGIMGRWFVIDDKFITLRVLMLFSINCFAHLMQMPYFLILDYTCRYFIAVSESGRYSVYPGCSAPVPAGPTCHSSFGCVHVL